MRVAVIGIGRRAQELYIPIIEKLPETQLHGICGASYEKTLFFSKKLGVIGYKNVEEVINDSRIDFIIACVGWTENSSVYQKLSNSDKPILLETPLGHDKNAIEECFKALSNRKAYTEVAEQYSSRPMEILKQELIKVGVFGDVFYAFNDGVGHEYHGISLIRSYLGFNQILKNVHSMQRDVPYFNHESHRGIFFAGERIQHSILEFNSGAQASMHWSWLNYTSQIRARRVSGFHGTRGSAWGEECVAFNDEKNPPEHIRFERRTRVVDGIEVIAEILAHFGEKVVARWSNPFSNLILNEDQIVAATFIHRMIKGINNEVAPLYPFIRAYEDHKIVEAINSAIRLNSPL